MMEAVLGSDSSCATEGRLVCPNLFFFLQPKGSALSHSFVMTDMCFPLRSSLWLHAELSLLLCLKWLPSTSVASGFALPWGRILNLHEPDIGKHSVPSVVNLFQKVFRMAKSCSCDVLCVEGLNIWTKELWRVKDPFKAVIGHRNEIWSHNRWPLLYVSWLLWLRTGQKYEFVPAADISTVICDKPEKAQLLLENCEQKKTPGLTTVILMDSFDDRLKERGATLNIEILSLQEVEVQYLPYLEGFIQMFLLEGRTCWTLWLYLERSYWMVMQQKHAYLGSPYWNRSGWRLTVC